MFARALYSCFFCYAVFISAAYGASRFVVDSIKIQGVSYRDEKIILSHIPIVVGKYFSEEDIDTSVKELYSTGYFSDVKIKVVNSVLNVSLIENKIINQLVFNGNSAIKDSQLKLIVSARSSSSYDKSVVNSDVNLIKKVYEYNGYPNVSVDVQVYPISQGMINLGYVITEGPRTKIKQINFLGNKSYSSGRLGGVISTKRSGYFSFLSNGSDIYNSQRLEYDEQLIRRFYHNRGYAGVKVSSQTIFDKHNNVYDLAFKIYEGAVYRIGNVFVQSVVQGVGHDSLRSCIKSKTGDLYSMQMIEESVENISQYLYSIGKPFVNVTSRINRDFVNKTVDVNYFIDNVSPIYVDRIEIQGNDLSRNHIILRELGFSEGDPINEMMIARAKRRIMSTGYFSNVDINQSLTGVLGRVILTVRVKQVKTSEIFLSTSWSEVSRNLSINFNENNWLGKGYVVYVMGSVGEGIDANYYNIGFKNPYFFGDHISAGFNISQSYFIDKFAKQYDGSFAVNVGFPISEHISTLSTFQYNSMIYGEKSKSDSDIGKYIDVLYKELADHGRFNVFSVLQSIVYDTLDNRIMPRDGWLVNFIYQYAGFGGDSNYHKLKNHTQYFYSLSDKYDIIYSIRFGLGYIFPRSSELQIFDQFSIGTDILRGFESKGIGPRLKGEQGEKGYAVGGSFYVSASSEIGFPIPFLSPDTGLRGSFFVDSANLYKNFFHLRDIGSHLDGDESFLRISAGAGINWDTPLGIIKVYYAIPMRKQPYDSVRYFGFGIGTRSY